MDPNKTFQSELHFKIVSFFYENPSSIDAAKGIATWVNHDLKEVEKVLEELVHLNILVAHRSEGVTGFAYTQDKEILNQIDHYFKNKIKDQIG